MDFYSQERIALFIDGANLFSSARMLHFDVDYKKLLKLFSAKGHLVRAFYYTALVEEQEYSSVRPLVDWLDYNGYTMITKPTKEFTDTTGRRKIKGNMDIEIATDIMEMADHLDHIVLFSGDGDFRRVVEAVQRKGIRVTVVSTVKSQPPMVADELRRQADIFLELQGLVPAIARCDASGNYYHKEHVYKKEQHQHASSRTTLLEEDNECIQGPEHDRENDILELDISEDDPHLRDPDAYKPAIKSVV